MNRTTESAARDDDRRALPAPTPAVPVDSPRGVDSPRRRSRLRVHRAWIVAAVTFVTIIGGAAFNSLPGLLIDPLHTEFGWSRGEIGLAVSLDMALYGLTAPFAAALMDRFGIRKVVVVALTMVEDSAVVFGWVLASHQVGAAMVAFLGGVARDVFGSYDVVWYASGALCAMAALMALIIRRKPAGTPGVPLTAD